MASTSATPLPRIGPGLSKALKGSTRIDGHQPYHQVRIQVVLRWEDGSIDDGLDGPPEAGDRDGHAAGLLRAHVADAAPQHLDGHRDADRKHSGCPYPSGSAFAAGPAGEPEPIVNMDCTTMTLGFDNPADGLPLKAGLRNLQGTEALHQHRPGREDERDVLRHGGLHGQAHRDGSPLTASPTRPGVNIDYQRPAGCDTSGQGGGLPVTGAAAGGIAGGAAVLLVAGGVLFVMARRRRKSYGSQALSEMQRDLPISAAWKCVRRKDMDKQAVRDGAPRVETCAVPRVRGRRKAESEAGGDGGVTPGFAWRL
jgi:hypothetical protein